MTRKQIVLAGFIGAIPVACGMLAAVCAFPTAFEIGFSLLPLIAFCAIASLLLSFWMTVPKYGFGFGALYLAGMILLIVYRFDRIRQGAVAFLCQTLRMLPQGIAGRFDLVRWEAETAGIQNPDLAVSVLLMLVAAAVGILLAYAVLRSKVVALPLLIPLPTVLLSFAYTNQPPALWTVVLLTVYYASVLLGNGFKKGESPERGRFLTILVPVLAAYTLLLLLFFPRKNFEPIPEHTRQEIFSDLFGDLGDRLTDRFGNGTPEEIDLGTVAGRENGSEAVFSVCANRGGAYHLRVHSYGAYGNNRWEKADPYDGAWHSLEALGDRQGDADATMEIRTSYTDERIVPYAFDGGDVRTGESYVPARSVSEYKWRYTRNYRIDPQEITDAERDYYRFAVERYTMRDGTERDALLSLAEQYGIAAPEEQNAYAVYNTALAVANSVRSGGTYTLHPNPVPDGQDFVLYFLTQGHEGYCMHFASATTAILQALGVPARYTSGYYVPNVSAEWQSVSEQAKHAWAEVYLLGVGWVPIESTPSFPENPPLLPMPPLIGELTNEPVPGETPKPTGGASIPTPAPNGQQTSRPGRETTAPGTVEDEPVEPGPTKNEPETRRGAWWLLLILTLPAIWAGVGVLVRKRREARFRDPNVRRAIPEMAYYLSRLERFGIRKDPDAERWATEAAFSDHAMKAERKELLKRVRAAQERVYRGKPFRRFVLRWIRWIL